MKKPKTEVRPHQRLLGGAIGSVVEIFDFSVYALTAPALAIHFFPKGDPAAALLATFAVFAAAFFARPLGVCFSASLAIALAECASCP